jgi:broad specificity phosphatase PhoE
MSLAPWRLILIRHGQTDWNISGRMQGQLESDLTELGRSQAKETARALAPREPLVIIASDLRRAWDTAVIMADHCDPAVPLVREPRLRETGLGEWEGLTHTEVDAQDPGVRSAWRFDARLAPPGGENRLDVAERAVPVVEELLAGRQHRTDRPAVLVAHGGVIAALVAALLDLPVEHWPVLGGLGNASWVELSAWGDEIEKPRWRLDVWNASAKVAPDVL